MTQFSKIRREFNFFWSSPVKHKVVVAARGSGKTVATLQFVMDALFKGKENMRAVFFSSTLKQVKQTVEPIMRDLTINFDNKMFKYNKSEHTYTFTLSTTDVRELILLSYENPEAKRGLHPQIIVLDECASMPADMFGNIILPMMTNSDDMLISIGTAQGRNKFYELFNMGLSAEYPDWESYRIRASDSSLFDADHLFAQRNSLTSAEYAQEYECDFNANVLVGSVYGEFMDRFTVNNIDASYCWIPNSPVYTAWDLGYSDYTAIWFYQIKNNRTFFIDYYEDSGKEISWYANFLKNKPYVYGIAYLPHDGAHHDVKGAPVQSQLRDLGIASEVLPMRSKFEGIDAARNLLKTCAFNSQTCEHGLQRLKSYKFKIDSKTGLKTRETIHDESSHCADAFRYAAISLEVLNISRASGKILMVSDYNVLV